MPVKVIKGAAGSRGGSESEGVCQRAFICGMVMTLFLQASQQTKRFLPFEYM